jgi:hypothetical protein
LASGRRAAPGRRPLRAAEAVGWRRRPCDRQTSQTVVHFRLQTYRWSGLGTLFHRTTRIALKPGFVLCYCYTCITNFSREITHKCNNNNRYTGRPTTILQVRARKHAVRERGCGRAFALVRAGDSDRGEQALHHTAELAGQPPRDTARASARAPRYTVTA